MSDTPPRRVLTKNRRVCKQDPLSDEQKNALVLLAKYVGSGHHKRYPAKYGLQVANPRPFSSLCDEARPLGLEEASALLAAGIAKGMVSERSTDNIPRFIWAVTDAREVFEAQTHENTPAIYHGYPLKDNDDMKAIVLKIWDSR
jgi:hypothetical protein